MSIAHKKSQKSQTKSKATEDQILIAVFDYVRLKALSDPLYLNIIHVENEKKRDIKKSISGGIERVYCPSGARAKRKGLSPGYPDIIVDVAKHGFHGLRIEVKKKGGKLTPAQAEWLTRLADQGYMAVCCVGYEAVIETITSYLGK